VHISNLRAQNVKMADGEFSSWQALLILGPVAASFNGPAGTVIPPVSKVTLTDCDFGTPRNGQEPVWVYNARDVVLTRVTIAGQVIDRTYAA
jgi:hypothetical protein